MSYDRYTVLMPVLNDWAACDRLLSALDEVLAAEGVGASVVLVDDGSTVRIPRDFARREFRALSAVDVLRLRRNLGHQRAICVGLSYLEHHCPRECEAVILMDSDGEDDPREIPRLLGRFHEEQGEKIVFAERTKRSESLVFRACYAVFRLLHWLLTSRGLHMGNYSVIPRHRLRSLAVAPELWNHYAAAVLATRQPWTLVPTARGRRLDGGSRMNFVGLVIHGLSAISVFSDVVGVRLLLATLGLAAAAGLGIAGVVGVRCFTTLAVPGWATFSAGLLAVLLVQAIMFSVLFSFIILANRNAATFLPARDCTALVDRVTSLYRRRAKRRQAVPP